MCGPTRQNGAISPTLETEQSLKPCPTAETLSEEGENQKVSAPDEIAHDRNIPFTSLTVVKYILSLALLLFSIVITISLIFQRSTKLSSDVSPWLALGILCGAILWLGMMEGQQASLVGLTGVVDHLVYKDTHPVAYRSIQLAYRGNNLDRYVTGRQFMVVLCVFIINLCGAPLPGSKDAFIGLPNIIQEIFLGSGLAMILMTAMISQLPPQVNASHCMIDFINNYFALFTLYFALAIEFLGVCHACYLIQNMIALISGKPVKTNEKRTWIQFIFFWARVVMSLVILCFSLTVTIVALFEGKTTMWQGVPDAVSLILFFVLLAIVGMLEAMQISFLATSKMRKEQRGTSFFGKKTVDVISRKNGQNLPAFMIGRQLMVVSCFFILARVTTLDVPVGEGQNIFGVPDGMQAFLNTGLHAALLMTILGSSTWKLAASAFPVEFMNSPLAYILLYLGLFLDWVGICSGAWVLARIEKRLMKLQLDETYVGTPENPTLSQDALDEMSTRDTMLDDGPPSSFSHDDAALDIEGEEIITPCGDVEKGIIQSTASKKANEKEI